MHQHYYVSPSVLDIYVASLLRPNAIPITATGYLVACRGLYSRVYDEAERRAGEEAKKR